MPCISCEEKKLKMADAFSYLGKWIKWERTGDYYQVLSIKSTGTPIKELGVQMEEEANMVWIAMERILSVSTDKPEK
jgi:nicotinic acid mononucleotide adenylyltransferase